MKVELEFMGSLLMMMMMMMMMMMIIMMMMMLIFQDHGFDFAALCSTWRLSFYQRIKLVNYVRHSVGSTEIIIITCRNSIVDSTHNLPAMRETAGHKVSLRFHG